MSKENTLKESFILLNSVPDFKKQSGANKSFESTHLPGEYFIVINLAI